MFQLNVDEHDSSHDLALAYFDNGYNVVPLQRSDKKPPSFFKGWEQYKTERPERNEVSSWFQNRDNLSVAIVCGSFLVVDADSPESMTWVEENLPITPVKVLTGKGMHFYYNNPQNYTTYATRRTDETPSERLIDIRGVGGLIIAPFNRHANGQIYKLKTIPEWDVIDHNDLPDFTEVEWKKVTGVSNTISNNSTAPFALDGVNEGSRNDSAARLAGYLISKNVNQDFIKFFMHSWNDQNKPPLPQKEVESVVDNVKKTHDRKNAVAPLFVKEQDNISRPKNLFNPPGLLKDMFDFCESLAQVPQPELSVVAALSLASVSCGRLYRTEMNNYSSLYFMCVAKSGQGKENIKTFVETVLNESKHKDLVVGDGYTSSGAVHSVLQVRPTQITIMDEFGKRLESISHQSNSNREDGIQTLMEAWGRCHGVLRADNYSLMGVPDDVKEKMMNRQTLKPAITLVGLSVPKNFYKALHSGRIADGFLNRFMVIESKEPRRVAGLKKWTKPPVTIVNWINMIRSSRFQTDELGQNNSQLNPAQNVLTFDNHAKDMLQEFAKEIVQRQDILEKENLEPLLSRSREKAMRLSLICALATDVKAKVINGDAMRWAIDYVKYYDLMFIEACRDKVASSATESRIKQVLSFIRSRGGEGISKREVDRHELFRSMKSYEVKEIIERLTNAREIQEIDVKVGGKGRPSKRYVAIDPTFYEE